jgi:hypothetical protein
MAFSDVVIARPEEAAHRSRAGLQPPPAFSSGSCMQHLLRMSIPLRVRMLVAGILLSIPALVLNPWVIGTDSMNDPVGDGILIAQGLLGIVWIIGVSASRLRHGCAREVSVESPRSPPAWNWAQVVVLLLVLALWLATFRDRWLRPELAKDDYDYLAFAARWQDTWRHLLDPYNEHLCVPTRLLTWAVCAVVPAGQLPRALALAGMALFVAACTLLLRFARREWGMPLLGPVAVSLFVLTDVHREVVTWYSASQWCWALLLLLWSLILLQSDGSRCMPRLTATAGLAVAAPFAYAVGLFVGPITSLYAVVKSRCSIHGGWSVSKRAVLSLLPAAAGVCSVAGIAAWKGPEIAQRASYGGQPAARAIAPFRGVLFGVRSTVDLLVLRNLGVERTDPLPRVVYAVAFPVLVFGVGELIRRTQHPRAVLVGVLLILLPYAATLPFRAWVHYESFLNWSRYQLFPHLGVVFLLCSALAEFGKQHGLGQPSPGRQALWAGGLAVLQFSVHAM